MNTPFKFRKLNMSDSQFVLKLLNDPQWLRFIGDRGIYTESDAKRYIEQNLQHFDDNGYGLWVVEAYLSEAIGLCGLLNRHVFNCPDLGFAFLPEGRGKGIATKAVGELISQAKYEFKFSFLTAICAPDNQRSLNLLEKNGFRSYGHYFVPNHQTPLKLLWLNIY